MAFFFLIIGLLIACSIFITKEELKKNRLRTKARILSIESDWLVVIHEEGSSNSIIYTYDQSAQTQPLNMVESFKINKKYSKRQNLYKEVKVGKEDLAGISGVISSAFLLVFKKAAVERDFKRNNTIYLITLNKNGRRIKISDTQSDST